MDSASNEQPVQISPPIEQPVHKVVAVTRRGFWAPLDRSGVLCKVMALVFWVGLGYFSYAAVQAPSDRAAAFGSSLLLIALAAVGFSMLARYLLGATAWAYRVPAIVFFAGLTLLAESRLFILVKDALISMPQLLALWGTVGVTLLMLGWTLDLAARSRSASERIALRADLLIASAVLLVSLVLRVSGPVTAAVDEVLIYCEMLNLSHFPHTKFWDTSSTANPYFISWLVYLFCEQVRSLVDSFIVEKFVVSFFASLSIALWYWAINMLCGRRVALTASVLLTFFGWHWVNSRFLYVYPYELAAISFATACGILAFGRGKFLAAAALGLTLTFSIFAKKISIMIFPLTAYLFIDFLIFRPTVSRKRVACTFAAVVAVFVLTYYPFIAADGDVGAHMKSSDRFFRFNQALEARSNRLAPLGLTPTQAYFHVFKDAVRQLFVQSSDGFRHYFRPRGPLLDPAVANIGVFSFLVCVLFSFWRRECRLALVGLFLFTLPMVLSFPLDSLDSQAIARRMIGNSLFLVLIAAIGADFLAKPFARFIPLWVIPALLCIASTTFNVRDYFTQYSKQSMSIWITDHGLRRAALLLAVRDAVRQGMTVLILDNDTYQAREGLIDLSNIEVMGSAQELRDAIVSRKAGRIMVVTPGGGPEYGFPSGSFVTQLADILPDHLWRPGRLGPSGYPLIMTLTIDHHA